MNKQNMIARAIADYRTGYYSWHDLKRNYPQLTITEIFYEVISKVNRSILGNSQIYTTKKPDHWSGNQGSRKPIELNRFSH